MATPNSDGLKEAIEAFWDYIGSKTAYTDLGLTEFRGYDGHVLPVKEDGSIDANDLPGMYVDSFDIGIDDQDTTPETEIVEVTMQGGVAFINTAMHKDHSSLLCMSAMMTLHDVILNREAIETNLGTGPGGAIDRYGFRTTGMVPVPSVQNPAEVLYWDGTWELVLAFVRNLPTAV